MRPARIRSRLILLNYDYRQGVVYTCHLVAATRPGYDLDRAWETIAASGLDFDVTYLEVPALAISSSYLRARVNAGQSLRYLTPDAVTGYLHKHGLYGASSSHYGHISGEDEL